MPLLGRLLRIKKKAKKVAGESERNGIAQDFLRGASNAVFSGAITMKDESTVNNQWTTINNSKTLIGRSTTINYIEQGKPVLETLAREMATGADVDSSARDPPPRCYPGTRTALTAKAQEWLFDDQRMWDIFWLYGPAGVGKSAVAQTIAEFAKDHHRLGAAFFFSKTGGRNKSHSVFITLAYQLAVRFPGYLPLVAKQLGADPDLLTKTVHVQFKQLIVEPLSSLSNELKHLIILDGLDECEGEQAQLDIVELINNLILSRTSLPVIWMICGRPEPHLMDALSRVDFPIQCWREELAVDTEESRDDTARFIRARFGEIRKKYRNYVEEDTNGCWPSEDDTTCITEEASGLFVFASTILRYIEDPQFAQPNAHLAHVLTVIRHSRMSGGRSPMEGLDLLYTRILSEVPETIWPVTHRLLKVAINPLGQYYHISSTPQLLSNFLRITRSEFYSAVHKLHSVLDVPSPADAYARPLRFYHASFRDYLVQPARSGRFCVTVPPDFKCNDEMQKLSLQVISLPICIPAAALKRGLPPSMSKLVESDHASTLVKNCLTWPSPDSAWNRELGDSLAMVSLTWIFRSYSSFHTHDDHHRELKAMLATFDFNPLTFSMNYCGKVIRDNFPSFVCWTKKTSLHDLVRTHSTSETDDELISRAKRLGAKPLDFQLLSNHGSFDKVRKLAYFLLGYRAGTILVLADPTVQWFEGFKYRPMKSPSEIWPSYAGFSPRVDVKTMNLIL